MFARKRGRIAIGVIAVGAVVALAGCSSGDPLDSGSTGSASGDTITIGSAAFAENEIIAEIYAQALEANGVTVNRSFNIGQRDVYLAALESGEIDLIPEYSGNLLQFYDEATEARTSDDVYAALAAALPDGFEVLDQSPAADEDSYNVTQAFSEANNVTSLADLASVSTPIALGGNSELATRPYGPDGLKSVYGVDVSFTPIEDSGGPLTLGALLDNTVQLVNIYSTTPSIADNNLVTLKDPDGLFLASNVVPLINSAKLTPEVTDVLNAVNAALTTEDLIDLNGQNQGDAKAQPAALATQWLADKNLFG